jgi:hypothetical protein
MNTGTEPKSKAMSSMAPQMMDPLIKELSLIGLVCTTWLI